VSSGPARTLVAAGTVATGAAAAAAAYLLVGGLPGLLYAAGIGLAAFFGAVAFLAGRPRQAPDPLLAPVAAARPPRWRRKSRIIAELEVELAETGAELEEHRQALGNLAEQRAREAETARATEQRLETEIQELESERERLVALIDQERERFEQTLETLGGGIGGHAHELEKLEKELEALIAR
jgi:septal ring factor EnvC (AmiA/AmiB activator)